MCLAFDAQNQKFWSLLFSFLIHSPILAEAFPSSPLSPRLLFFFLSLQPADQLFAICDWSELQRGKPYFSPLTPFLPRSPLPLYITPLSRDTASRLVVCSVIDPWVAVVTV